jgi:3-phenylpropionate/trans-cinnamate dioxygenase ferredoxin subunit
VLVEVAAANDLREGVGAVVVAEGREIMVVRWRGEVYAVRNICPHQSAPFSIANRVSARGAPVVHAGVSGASTFGELERDDEAFLTCPWHTWSFSLRDGTCTVDPGLRVKTYRVVIENGKVYLDMGKDSKPARQTTDRPRPASA